MTMNAVFSSWGSAARLPRALLAAGVVCAALVVANPARAQSEASAALSMLPVASVVGTASVASAAAGAVVTVPAALSVGQRQRVSCARALAHGPQLVLADEPTGNLDPKHSWDIVRLLEKINDYGTTVVLTTHNVEIVNKLKRRVITIDGGKITHDQSQGSYKQ